MERPEKPDQAFAFLDKADGFCLWMVKIALRI
jgi:hypothetical protein